MSAGTHRAAASASIGCAPLPACSVPARRERLRLSGTLNGIDYVEVGDDGVSLCVHLFGDIPPGLGVANVRISGGDRITGLRVLSVSAEHEPDLHDDACLRVVLDREGDHTAYCLCLVDAASGDGSGRLAGVSGLRPALCLRHRCSSASIARATLDCADATLVRASARRRRRRSTTWPRTTPASASCCSTASRRTCPAWQERHVPGPRHRAGRGAGLHRRLPQLLPGRGGHRGLPRHRAPAHLGASACAAGRLPHARRLQRACAGHAGLQRRRPRASRWTTCCCWCRRRRQAMRRPGVIDADPARRGTIARVRCCSSRWRWTAGTN